MCIHSLLNIVMMYILLLIILFVLLLILCFLYIAVVVLSTQHASVNEALDFVHEFSNVSYIRIWLPFVY